MKYINHIVLLGLMGSASLYVRPLLKLPVLFIRNMKNNINEKIVKHPIV